MASPSSIIAKYAKSNQSTWKSSGQEAIAKLIAECDLESEQGSDHGEKKVAEGNEENSSKKSKPPVKIIVEYAKSSRSSCKICTKAIPATSLRLGSIIKERGRRDVTSWYHPVCFITDSQPIILLDEIDGFSSLESCDQKALQRVMDGCHKLPMSASPPSNQSWVGGASVAIVLERLKLIILAGDFELFRKELIPSYMRCYEFSNYEYYREKSGTGFLHELDSVTACAVVGSRSTADSWYNKLESELGSLIKKDSMTNTRKVKPKKNDFKLMDISLKILSEYQLKELHEQYKPVAEVLLVGWNEKREPCLHHMSNYGYRRIKEGYFWAGRGSHSMMREFDHIQATKKIQEMSKSEAVTNAEKLIYSSYEATETPGNGVEVWILQPGLPIQKNFKSMEDLRLQFGDV